MLPLSTGELIMSGPLLVAGAVAAVAGAVSFFSPCCLPLVPGYLSYVAGVSGAELTGEPPAGPRREAAAVSSTGPPEGQQAVATAAVRVPVRGRTVASAVLFVAGFTAVFASYGMLFGSLGAWLLAYQDMVVRVLGVVTILLGLMFTGVLSWLPLASATLRLDYRPRTGLLGAPVVGAVFGLGWTPCIGPTLAAVLTLSTTSATAGRGAFLSVAYALGLGGPFILAALSWQRMTRTFGWARRHAQAIMRFGGSLLIVLGIVQVSGLWRWVTSWIQTLVVNWVVPL